MDTSKWETSDVYVSLTGAVNPPSIGSVVFDDMDNYGNFHSSAYTQNHIADVLTSVPIDLNYPGDQTIYLSFFYEAQGFLETPDPKDSLVLQFYAPNQKKWITVWYAEGHSQSIENPIFEQVIIHITDTAYLQKGFRFRFYNRASLSSSAYPDLVGNCDFWFIDYIELDKNRTANDTIFKDIAFQMPPLFKFDDYMNIPYSHYKENSQEFAVNYKFFIRNNDPGLRNIDSVYIAWHETNNNVSDDTLYAGSYVVPPSSNVLLENENINFHFPTTQSDILEYQMTLKLKTDAYDYAPNNKLTIPKKLNVFYAYDDGSAENGYGIVGDNSQYAYVAQKFITKKQDYITAVSFYFNKTFKDAQPFYFNLIIWNKDNNGLPGEILAFKQGMEINHDRLNNFQTYILDTPVLVTDTFFIGWQKITDNFLNVGLDLNTTDENYKYYNIYGDWQTSTLPGVLMIRPFFGDPALKITENTSNKIYVYPNPAQDYIILKTPCPGNVEIFNAEGIKTISFETKKNEAKKDISYLTPGLYFIKFTGKENTFLLKFIKN